MERDTSVVEVRAMKAALVEDDEAVTLLLSGQRRAQQRYAHASAVYLDRLEPAFTRKLRKVDAVLTINQEALYACTARAADQSQLVSWIAVCAGVLIVGVALFLAVRMSGTMLAAFRSLARQTEEIGHLTAVWQAPRGFVAILPLLALSVMAATCAGQDQQARGTPDPLTANPLTAPGSLQARIRFQHLTSAEGLSQDQVFAILQDRKGFMWFGTQGGLNRYDGAVITQYRHDPRNPNSPSGDFVTDVLEDKRGAIWFSSPGLNKFDLSTGKFTRYRPTNLPKTKNDPFHISKLYQDAHGLLWITTHGRILYRFDTERESFTEFDIGIDRPDELQNIATAIQEDAAGVMWIGTYRGLVRVDPATGRVDFHKRWDSQNAEAEGVWALALDVEGKLYVSCEKRLSRFDPRSQTFTHNWPWTDRAAALLPDPTGLLWAATRSGLRLLDPRTGLFRTLAHDPADRYSLRANDVTSLRYDRDGNLWVGTKSAGVSWFSQQVLRFGAWRKGPGGVGTVNESNVRAIYVDRSGVVWLGTYGGGLNRFEPGSGQFYYYRHNSRDPGIARDVIFAVYEDRQADLWLSHDAGLSRFDRESGAFHHFQRGRLYSILEDRRGRFWLGANLLFDRRNGTFSQTTAGELDSTGLLSIYEDRHGNIWSAARVGIRKMDNAGISREIPLARDVDASGPPRVQVNFIHEDAEGTLWLATETGLVQFDPKSERHIDYTTNEGLPDNIVQCILPDEAGNLWISTSKGISRFNPKEKSFFNYSESDGLQGQFFNRKACFRDESGWMYFGGLNGFNRFHPKQILNSPATLPPVVLTKLQINGETVPVAAGSILPKPIWDTTDLALAHNQNGLSLEFAALSYANRPKIRYRFKLENLEKQWTVVDTQQRSARYTGLRPGEYLFRVQASPDGGVNWAEQGASLRLDVAPPWWNTPWTKSAWVLAFLGLMLGTHKLRVTRLQRRQLRLERVVERRTAQLVVARDDAQAANRRAEEATAMKSMFLANMSHEIRTPMNAVIGMAYLALKTPLTEKQRDYINKIHNAGTSLLGVINDILDFSKIEAGKLDVESVDFRIDDVIASVTSITAQKAQDKGLEFLAEVASSVPQSLVGDPLRLGQIIANVINNAIKFTEHGDVYLKVELIEQVGERVRLRFSVKDTGIGMTPEQVARLFQPFNQADMSTTRKHGGTGLGLTICRRLVELMGGEIWLESEPAVGSTFLFTVSLGVSSGSERSRIIPAQLRTISALVVDDNAAARDIMVHALDGILARVDAVSSGDEAIAAVEQPNSDRRYDVIFMDWRMPRMDGIQAARLIKQNTQLKTHPVIVLVTAFGCEDVREEAERVHIDGFLLKPVTASMLVNTLVTLFSGATHERTALSPELDRHADRLRGVRILLAEDHEINQQIAVELLQSAGATAEIANNGREAVEKMFNGPQPPPFDVILMDLQMPEMDGFQATAKIRSDERFAQLPILAMTAHATFEERQRCLQAGMNGHIAKPIDPEALFSTIRLNVKVDESPRAIAPEPVAPAEPKRHHGLRAVAGLDANDGLRRVAGDEKLYMRLLARFVETEANVTQRIEVEMARGEFKTAERMAHNVKGVAGNLGAAGVQAAASVLEKAISSGAPPEQVNTARARLDQVLGELVCGLRNVLPGEEPEATQLATAAVPSIDMSELKPVIAELSRRLADYDSTSMDYLAEVAGKVRALFPEEQFKEFRKLVKDYAFEDALERLTAAAAHRV